MSYKFFGCAFALFGLSALTFASDVHSSEPVEVYGYFCSAKNEQVAFLQHRASGESEEVAANFVNKTAGKLTCAYFMPAKAIPAHVETITSEGLVFSVQSYIFLPEKIERWTGTFFGSLQKRKPSSTL